MKTIEELDREYGIHIKPFIEAIGRCKFGSDDYDKAMTDYRVQDKKYKRDRTTIADFNRSSPTKQLCTIAKMLAKEQ